MNDIDWELLVRYVAAVATDAEREEVERWLGASPEHREILDGVRAAIAQSRRELSPKDEAAMLASLKREIAAAAPDGSARPPLKIVRDDRARTVRLTFPARRSPWLARVRAAAAAVLIVGAGAAGVWLLDSPSRQEQVGEEPTVVATRRGQRLSVRLADNTVVVLAPASRLEVAPGYGKPERRVRLEGEAAFTVEHDEARPFAVETRRAVARDLGTWFVVRAYEDDSATEVVVAEGLVAVAPAEDAASAAAVDSVLVTPGQLARVGADGQLGVTRGVAVERYFAWTEDRLVFENTPLAEVAARIERWYDVEVRLADPATATWPVTVTFEHERPEDVLRLTAGLLGLDVAIANGPTGQTYTLRPR